MRRICPKKSYLVANVRKLKDKFQERGYPEDMVNKETKRALESPSLGRSKTSERSVSGNGGTGVPLLINYNPILCRLGQVIRLLEIRFIDKMDPSDPTRREDFWIDTLKIRYPQGLNNIDPYH